MSTSASDSGEPNPLDVPPSFDLCAEYDDPDDPTEVTVRPADPESPTTEWLTIDAGTVIPLEETV